MSRPIYEKILEGKNAMERVNLLIRTLQNHDYVGEFSASDTEQLQNILEKIRTANDGLYQPTVPLAEKAEFTTEEIDRYIDTITPPAKSLVENLCLLDIFYGDVQGISGTLENLGNEILAIARPMLEDLDRVWQWKDEYQA